MSEKRNDPVLETLSPADRVRFLNMVKKGITRRDFMHYMMAAGATAAASGTLFTGMSDVWASTPKRGGRVIFAGDQHGPNDTLDPALFTSATDYFRGRMYYGSLTRLTKNLGYEPELAEEILSNDSATEWTFKIRKGVEFHDGKTLTAEAIAELLHKPLYAVSMGELGTTPEALPQITPQPSASAVSEAHHPISATFCPLGRSGSGSA